MHDGCSGNAASGKEIVDKIRMMGFRAVEIHCSHCGTIFTMETMELLAYEDEYDELLKALHQ